MTAYRIAFNDSWVPDLTDEDLRHASERVRALRAEMEAAKVLVFTGGVDPAGPVFSVDASSGKPVFTDGPFVETKGAEVARLWAGRIAVACGWPQEVRPIQTPREHPESDGPAARMASST